jgi:hypothetical protein
LISGLWQPILLGLTGHSGISSRVARRVGFLPRILKGNKLFG